MLSDMARYSTDMQSFHDALKSSSRIVALCGAGLSASSGLPTFRGAGGLWRNFDAISLATPEAFDRDPALVWQFYNYRRHMALNAKPNAAHYALAELAKKTDKFMCMSQNVDGLSPRAGHPRGSLRLLHGSLFDIRCSGFYCKHFEQDNYTDPIVPTLAIPKAIPTTTESLDGSAAGEALAAALKGNTDLDISDAKVDLPAIPPEDLPRCPKCHNLTRPGVVWFGESLPTDVLEAIDDYFDEPEEIDLMLVIGTSARVWPAAGYVDEARKKKARIAVINMDEGDLPKSEMTDRDWFFKGDAGALIPQMLKPIIGSEARWDNIS